MLGGGQLGRMFTVAAQTLGYRVMVLDPDPHSPAGRIADEHLQTDFGDEKALQRLAQACAAVTTEFENIPAATLRQLAEQVPVRPSAEAVEIAQNRIREKNFIRDIDLQTATFAVIKNREEIDAACQTVSFPAILKIAELGYDGKGQVVAQESAAVSAAFETLGKMPCVLEEKIALDKEISVILARNSNGESRCFPVAENEHRNGILHKAIVPASVDEALSARAQKMAIFLADALNYCGVLAVEFFISQQGELLVNEIAPRTHNSGHFTIDACITSQFEQQLRMLCDLPFGDVQLRCPVVMLNLLGDLWQAKDPAWGKLLEDPRVKLHLYGKHEARPGRKMGHFCYLAEDAEQAETLFAALA
jgi:5-(carboxyamino)imidazole ribonucleotide synthase